MPAVVCGWIASQLKHSFFCFKCLLWPAPTLWWQRSFPCRSGAMTGLQEWIVFRFSFLKTKSNASCSLSKVRLQFPLAKFRLSFKYWPKSHYNLFILKNWIPVLRPKSYYSFLYFFYAYCSLLWPKSHCNFL